MQLVMGFKSHLKLTQEECFNTPRLLFPLTHSQVFAGEDESSVAVYVCNHYPNSSGPLETCSPITSETLMCYSVDPRGVLHVKQTSQTQCKTQTLIFNIRQCNSAVTQMWGS